MGDIQGEMMKIGDILLVRKKYCPISWLIRKGCKSHYNHVCWALDNDCIVEVDADGKHISPLSKYLSWEYEVKLMRFKTFNWANLKAMVARTYYGVKKHSYLSFLIVVYLMWTKQYHKIKRKTCASFVAYHLSEGYILNNKRWQEITPRDFEYCEDLKDVTNEIVGRK